MLWRLGHAAPDAAPLATEMARADLVKRLFRAYARTDVEGFRTAASEIVSEERRKNHTILANELSRILNDVPQSMPSSELDLLSGLAPIPRDTDRDATLLDIRLPKRRLSSLVLEPKTLATVEAVLKEFRDWDVLEGHDLRPRHRLLFFGPPGCGKTATAEGISAELGLPLLYVRMDALITSLLGETASNIRKVFDFARAGSWVLFFDEFDAIGRSRTSDDDHAELKRVVNTFLQVLDQYEGKSLIIAATNHHSILDYAIWRRFDEVMKFDYPSAQQANALLKMLLCGWAEEPFPKEVTNDLTGMSHADIERLCLDAKRQSVVAGTRSVTIHQLKLAIQHQAERRELLREMGGVQTLGKTGHDDDGEQS